MKKQFLGMMIVTAISGAAFAKAAPKVLTTEEFNKQVTDLVYNNGDAFTGELSLNSQECQVTVSKEEKGIRVAIEQDGKQVVSVLALSDAKIRVFGKDDSDGSFSKTFQTGLASSVTVTHVDDAYDEISLDSGDTKLTCGAYY
jgi:hypothetical protein